MRKRGEERRGIEGIGKGKKEGKGEEERNERGMYREKVREDL